MSTLARVRGRAVLSMIARLRTDPLRMLINISQQHGDRVSLPTIARHPLFLLSKPDDVAHVLVANQANYVKAPTYRPLREVLGNGLLTNEGEHWARQRKLLQPMFARRHVVRNAAAMVSATTRMLDGWAARPDGTVLDVAEEMSALTLDVVGRALFSADLTGEAGELAPALTTVLNAYIAVVRNPLFWLLPNYEKWRTPNRRRAAVAENHLRSVVERIITARQASASRAETDLLDMLLAARDETTGAAMSDQQVRDELMTFLLAGHETTANTLAWTFYLLSTHPEARVRLEAEVDTVLAGRPPTAEDEDQLEWTAAVVGESMRLYPPAWILERQALAEDSWDGLVLPAGSIAITPPYLIHRNPDHWPNPEGFDPTRFLPGAPARHRYAYLPFGGGRRQCIGGGFATLEATLLLATITQRTRLNLVPGAHPVPQPTVTLRPSGLSMTLHHRGAVAPTSSQAPSRRSDDRPSSLRN
jgi:cytochrome P450